MSTHTEEVNKTLLYHSICVLYWVVHVFAVVRSPNLPDISAIHSTTLSSVTHIDETMSTTTKSRHSSTDTPADLPASDVKRNPNHDAIDTNHKYEVLTNRKVRSEVTQQFKCRLFG